MLTRTCCPGCSSAEISPLLSRRTKEATITIALCECCGLAFVNPMFEDADKAALEPNVRQLHRSRSAELGDARALKRSRRRANRWSYAITRWLKPPPDHSRVLEIGAGDGALVELLLRHGHEVVALDPDAESCGYIADRFGIRTIASRIDDANLEGGADFDVGGEGFDAVFMLNLIEHLEDPAAVLRRLHGVLNPGGIVAIETPNILRTKVGPRRMFSFPHNYYFSPQSLARLVQAQGYQPVHCRVYPRDMFHLIVRRLSDRAGTSPQQERETTEIETTETLRHGARSGIEEVQSESHQRACLSACSCASPVQREWTAAPTGHAAQVRRAIRNHHWRYYLEGQYLWRKLPVVKQWYLYGRPRDWTP